MLDERSRAGRPCYRADARGPKTAVEFKARRCPWKRMNDQTRPSEETLEALRKAEQKYRSIFEHCLEGIFQTTPEGKYLSANPALARIYGYESADELIAALTDIGNQLYVEPARRAEFTRLVREEGKVIDFESQVYRRDRGVIW